MVQYEVAPSYSLYPNQESAHPLKQPQRRSRLCLELEGKKQRVENQENVSNLVIVGTELNQVAYMD